MMKEIGNYVAKLVYLWIRIEGKSTPAEIVEKVGVKRRTVMDALAELRAGGYIVRISAGLYCAASRTDDAATRTEDAANRSESADTRTCAASRTGPSAGNRTESAASRTDSAQRNIIKQNKSKEKKDFSLEKSTDNILEYVDPTSELFIAQRISTAKFFAERGISPDLIDRITVAHLLKLPGASADDMRALKAEAFEAVAADRVPSRWIHISNQMRKVFEAAGWTWTKCRTEREKTLQDLNRVRAAKAAAEQLAAEKPETPPELNGAKIRKCSSRGSGAGLKPDALEKLGEKLRKKTG